MRKISSPMSSTVLAQSEWRIRDLTWDGGFERRPAPSPALGVLAVAAILGHVLSTSTPASWLALVVVNF